MGLSPRMSRAFRELSEELSDGRIGLSACDRYYDRAEGHSALDNMRLDPSAMIAGRPALDIRRLLRRTHGTWIDVQTVGVGLGLSPREADAVIAGLEKAELVAKKIATALDDRQRQFWKNTIKGNALAMATNARPVKRSGARPKDEQHPHETDGDGEPLTPSHVLAEKDRGERRHQGDV